MKLSDEGRGGGGGRKRRRRRRWRGRRRCSTRMTQSLFRMYVGIVHEGVTGIRKESLREKEKEKKGKKE